MPHNYAVLGAGRQGTAAAYDMAHWGDAERVLLVIGDQLIEASMAGGVETQVPAGPFVEELRRRGIDVTEWLTF